MALVTCRTTIAISVPPGTHLHLCEVKHLRVECLAQGHNIDTTMYHRYPFDEKNNNKHAKKIISKTLKIRVK